MDILLIVLLITLSVWMIYMFIKLIYTNAKPELKFQNEEIPIDSVEFECVNILEQLENNEGQDE